MLIFLAALTGVPRELHEAASIDGAGAARRFRHVSLPLITGALAMVVILLVIGGFNVFTSVLLMIGNDPLQQKQVRLTYMYDQAFSFLDFGYGSAIRSSSRGWCWHSPGCSTWSLSGRCGGCSRDRRRPPSAHRRDGHPLRDLIIAAVVLVLPFVYMVSTSLKSRSLVLVPTEAHPGPPDHRELRRRLGLAELRSVLPELHARGDRHDGPHRAAGGDDGLRLRPLRLSWSALLFAAVVVGLMVPTMS